GFSRWLQDLYRRPADAGRRRRSGARYRSAGLRRLFGAADDHGSVRRDLFAARAEGGFGEGLAVRRAEFPASMWRKLGALLIRPFGAPSPSRGEGGNRARSRQNFRSRPPFICSSAIGL